MESFNITNQTNFLIYSVPEITYLDLRKHLDTADPMYLGSYNYTTPVKENDIIMIYKKESKKNMNGFVDILNTKSCLLDNTKTNYKVYNDKNYNKYIVKIDTLISFDPINLPEINDKLIKSAYYKGIPSFRKKYIGTVEFKPIEKELGLLLMETLLNYEEPQKELEKPKPKGRPPKKEEKIKIKNKTILEEIEEESDQSDNNNEDEDEDEDNDDVISFDNKSNESNQSNQSNNLNNSKGLIPVMVIVCDKLINVIENGYDDDQSAVIDIMQHLYSCKKCDITDNGDTRIKLHIQLKDQDKKNQGKKDRNITRINMKFTEIDSSFDTYETMIDAYQNLRGYCEPFFEKNNDENNISICYIDDENDMYNKCLLITGNISENSQEQLIKIDN